MRRLFDVVIVALQAPSDAYPNAKYAEASLRAHGAVREIVAATAPIRLGASAVGSRRSRFRAMWRLLGALLSVFPRALLHGRQRTVYVSYPAVPLLLLWSLVPRFLRPSRLVADAFISLYDTAVVDRALIRNRVVARMLRLLERRAFSRADVVVVDTRQNAAYLAALLGLPEAKFTAVPLQTNEVDYRPVPYRASAGRCTILFIGTFVPLQGIEVIAEAARRLASTGLVHFRIIGDGQGSAHVERLAADLPQVVSWERKWLTAAELAREIENADICLGIFSSNPKAQRVCPYKLYAYSRVGRPVITGDTAWTRAAIANGPAPFLSVPVGDAAALADAVHLLCKDPALRESLARRMATFYERELASALGASRLAEIVFKGRRRQGGGNA